MPDIQNNGTKKGRINFKRFARKADYIALGQYDETGLYFIDDTEELFMGENQYGVSIEYGQTLPTPLFKNKLYIITDNGVTRHYIYDGFAAIDLTEMFPAASLIARGIVQLNNAIDEDDETKAATSKAVKTAYDELDEKITKVSAKFLEIFDNLTEIEFWEHYFAGEIENGMYQYMAEVLGFQKFGDAAFAIATNPVYTYERYTNYAESSDRYFFGNIDTAEASSGIVFMDKDGSNTDRAQFYYGASLPMRTYTYLGKGMGSIGIDLDGNVYCNAANTSYYNGSVVSLDGADPLNALRHRVNDVPDTGYIFSQYSYNWSNDIAAISLQSNLTVNHGGIFGIVPNSNMPVIYFKNRAEYARTSSSYIIAPNLVAADKAGNNLYAFVGLQLLKFDTACGVTTYTPTLPVNSFIPGTNSHFMFIRNGKIWICLLISNLSTYARNVYNLVFDISTGTFITASTYSAIPSTTAGIYTAGNYIEQDNSIIISIFTNNLISYLKWNYDNNTFTDKQITSVIISYNDYSHFDTDDGGNILRAYKNSDQKVQLDVINPADFTSYSYVSNADTELQAFTTIKSSDGLYYSFGYAANKGDVIIVDEHGNVDILTISSAQFNIWTIPQRPLLTEHNTFILLNPSMRGGAIGAVFDKLERRMSNDIFNLVNFSYSMPFIRVGNNELLQDLNLNAKEFIYNNWSKLAVIVEDWAPVTKIVSAGHIILNSLRQTN